MALEHAEGDELRAGEHLLEGVRHRVEDQRVERPVRAERRHGHRAALVDADRHVELLGGVPQRVVGPVRQRAPETGVRPDEAGDEPELGHGPPQLVHGGGRVLQRQHAPRRRGGRDPPRSSRPASRCRRRPARRPPRGPRRWRSTARWSGRGPTGRSPRRPCRPGGRAGSEPPGCASAKRAEGRRVVEGRAGSGQRAERDGQDLGAAHRDVLVAVGVAVIDRPVGLGQLFEGRQRLDHMAVGVDHRPGPRREGVAHAPGPPRPGRDRHAPAATLGQQRGGTGGPRCRRPRRGVRLRGGPPSSRAGRAGCRATTSRRGGSRSQP